MDNLIFLLKCDVEGRKWVSGIPAALNKSFLVAINCIVRTCLRRRE